ncbi:DUF4381 domain-containing protein [Methylicorpusculum sp.]|uniref:DUF4381 domain-containing protein n=1 Tax=Methylicorpusculum sp. TaxID=2713644 RepID=UPI002719DE37|nr:DUF4381 domain-containing protein [Methylicorpusculum sp.]MDO8844722.1 DUF4381 domain-containing protein [Methylicorpusculum sp.]MDP2178971.1 DUF4381 domain-containing protein [Methylicorpusculum sp.]MDP3528440.1 DUF4381 domain-containing protein [Methylicorpusculum sp.]MDZ4151618.1 DUF4381 domain-containing protein [Methylicorpusculum sp.]
MESAELPLKDIHLPDAIGWWPPAMGWWLLVILIPLMILLLIKLIRHITRSTAIKSAKRILTEIKQDSTKNELEKLREISILLRRVAVSVAPRENIAGLTGQAWLDFLDQGMKDKPFTQGIGQCLINTPYQNKTSINVDINHLISLCQQWLKVQAKRKK